MGGGNSRNIILEATEMNDTVPARKAILDILVRNTAGTNTYIDLSVTSRLPMAFVRLESYSLFGIFRTSHSGSLTITRLTASEIEGTFSAIMDDGLVADGSFAGKF